MYLLRFWVRSSVREKGQAIDENSLRYKCMDGCKVGHAPGPVLQPSPCPVATPLGRGYGE